MSGRYVTLKIDSAAVVGQTKEHVNRGLRNAGVAVRNKLRRNLSKPFPPASRAGDFPHRRKGDLQRKVRYVLDASHTTVAIYSQAPYSSYLEDGTKHMRPRKLVVKTVLSMSAEILSLVAEG